MEPPNPKFAKSVGMCNVKSTYTYGITLYLLLSHPWLNSKRIISIEKYFNFDIENTIFYVFIRNLKDTKLMKFKIKRLSLIPVLLLLGTLTITAQSRTVKKAQRKADKAKKEAQKAFDKKQEEGKKRHYEMQTDEVKKRMKQSRKEAKKFNDRKEPFYKDLFRKKKRRRKK